MSEPVVANDDARPVTIAEIASARMEQALDELVGDAMMACRERSKEKAA